MNGFEREIGHIPNNLSPIHQVYETIGWQQTVETLVLPKNIIVARLSTDEI